jgi:hypothetical protein
MGCPEVSFSAKIDELQKGNVSLSSKLSQWQYQDGQSEQTVNQLSVALEEIQRGNEKLEHYIQEWKLRAERSQGMIDRHYEEIGKIFAILEKIKSEVYQL